jgi:hypothetical protein
MTWRLAWHRRYQGRLLASGDGYGRGYFRWWACGPFQVRRYDA